MNEEKTKESQLPAVDTIVDSAIERITERMNLAVPEPPKLDLFDEKKWAHALLVARTVSQAASLPKTYRGNTSSVLVALIRAQNLKIDPFFLMEHTFDVNGKIGYDAVIVITLINRSGRLKRNLYWEEMTGEGNGRTATIVADLRDGRTIKYSVSYQLAVDNGWPEVAILGKIWKYNKDQKLRYKAATMMGKLYFPDVTGGIEAIDDMIESGAYESEPENNEPLFDREPTTESPAQKTDVEPEKQTPEKEKKKRKGRAKPVQKTLVTDQPKEKTVQEKIVDHLDDSGKEFVEELEKAEEKEEFKKRPPATIRVLQDEILKNMLDRGVNGIEFCTYLIEKKRLGEGEGFFHLSNDLTEMIYNNFESSMESFGKWRRNNEIRDHKIHNTQESLGL